MSSNKETFGKTVGFVVAVCLVCAALVSVSAVQLKPLQKANKLLDKQTKILEASGLLDQAGKDIVGTYNKYVEAKLIDLDSGEFIEGDASTFDERREARDPQKSSKPENDIAGINRRADNSVVYLVKNDAGQVESVVLPIVGSGLWDLMHGYVGLEKDLNTVKSVIYSDHKETPGLGAEVLNPNWKALWPGKKLFDEQGDVAIKIVKGGAKQGDIHGVDALSGATLTSVGVEKTFVFWFGDEGYGPFIENYRNGGLN
ncbi:Na(+)-translocating NADH-quinone reductase subunit C [Thalassotalea mangrovi]|uniref:Na(+)-translocating NADH-quinone reductase subunit C n=1 Tax=Thalassotalea mangrovi TaxID=2572245 RepID=A0A4U1B4H3_9GAMM|nr:Na(+)-translocating NADH-quinone reductase subunit C [Thalassotalea mangrovi]TKB45056.1 Na(+)-translocating NADH-quinone reductase subunit C [Thalassotalea mangrovi]